MLKKFLSNFDFKDKASELVWDSTFMGLWVGFLVVDLGKASYIAASIDLVLIVWFYSNIKTTLKQVRAEHGTEAN